MAYDTCPVCEAVMTKDHICFEYDSSEFSIELELLGLPFSLEPYPQVEEKMVPYVVTETPIRHEQTERAGLGFLGISVNKRPSPLFLRL